MAPLLVHATAILIGRTGILLVGPSGSGKSSLAMALIAQARRLGWRSQLVGDDQIALSLVEGRIIATGPETLRGRIEIRGSGIGRVDHVASAAMHFALMPVAVTAENRQPPEDLFYEPAPGIRLPMMPIDRTCRDPLAVLEAMAHSLPFRP